MKKYNIYFNRVILFLVNMINSSDVLFKNKEFNLLLLSQAVSSIGDAFHFIAVVTLLVNLSGNGIAAAFGIIAYPFVSIMFSFLAGSIGDRFNPKFIMVVLDLARAILTFSFVFAKSIFVIYLLISILSVLDVLYAPSKRKITMCIINKEGLLSANLILNGVLGATFVIGPTAAGIIIAFSGYPAAFAIKSASCFVSAIILAAVQIKNVNSKADSNIIKDIKEGCLYCAEDKRLKFVIFISSFLFAALTCINISFYPYAFDVLRITPKSWSFMMSVYYGASFITLIASGFIEKVLKDNFKGAVFFLVAILSVIWFSYGFTKEISTVFLLQAVEGLLSSLCLVIINTQLLVISRKNFAARATAVNDFFNNLGKLGGIALTYPLLRAFSVKYMFYIASIGLFLTVCLSNLVFICSVKKGKSKSSLLRH